MVQEDGGHELRLAGRKKLTVSGVTEVASFDETAVVLATGMGTLVVSGSALQLKNLTLEGGRVEVEGNVVSLVYEEERPAASWLRRLLG